MNTQTTEPDVDEGGGHRLTGFVARVRARVEAVTKDIVDRREHSATIDTVFTANEHNRRLAGNLLASAVAYRLFLWLLPLALVASAAAGFLNRDDTASLEDYGVSSYVRSIVDAAADQAHRSRWVILFIGLYALFSSSKACYRALLVIHQLAWGMPTNPPARKWKGALGFLGFALIAFVAGLMLQGVRARFNEYGLAAMLSTFVLYGGLWLGASRLLPHGDAPWTALIPGAVLLSAGVAGLHLFTFFYLDRKLASSSQLYGALGAAAAILLWLYLIGYLIVASAVLNVTRWGRRVTPRG